MTCPHRCSPLPGYLMNEGCFLSLRIIVSWGTFLFGFGPLLAGPPSAMIREATLASRRCFYLIVWSALDPYTFSSKAESRPEPSFVVICTRSRYEFLTLGYEPNAIDKACPRLLRSVPSLYYCPTSAIRGRSCRCTQPLWISRFFRCYAIDRAGSSRRRFR
jgi:hypothetical protein